MVRFVESEKKWILETAHSGLSLALSPEGFLLVTWFGSRFPDAADYPQAESLPGWASFGPGESLVSEAYPPRGGARYAEPCLRVEYPDGVRDLRLGYRAYRIEGETLVVTLADPVYPLSVDVSWEAVTECDLFLQRASVRNEGSSDVSVEQVLSGVLYARRGPSYRLTHLAGRWAGETQLQRTMLSEAKTTIESRRGFTSHTMNPFFALDPEGSSDETHGEVYFGALAWSGNWKIAIERDDFGLTRASAGLNDYEFSMSLGGSESFTTPAFAYGFTDRGFGQMSRNLHAYQRKYLASPEASGNRRKILYNSWEATNFAVDEAGQKRLADIAASLGVELFVMDDGWFGKRNDDRAGLGDWQVNKEKFPNGLDGLIAYVKSRGMDFGLWVEPEMVNPDSDLYRAHPDWVYHVPGRPLLEQRNQLVLNLARPDVRQFVFETLDGLLSAHGISFIKWDLNRNISELGWLPGYRGDLVVDHIRAVYDIVARLRERYPDVLFQSCSGGGGRVDLGILAHFDQIWPSDNTDAFDRLLIQEGFSFAYGAHLMESWVTAERNWLTGRSIPLEFRFHVSMAGTLGIGEDLAKWDEAERAQVRACLALYKDIRDTVQNGDLYRLLSPREAAVSATEYVSASRDRAVLFAYAFKGHFGHAPYPFLLAGLDPVARYAASGPGIDITMSGAAFMTRGISLNLRGDYASVVVVLKRL